MADELLDLVDKNDQTIGTVYKSAAHINPELIHREIVVYIFDKKGNVLLQQRSYKKKTSPGKWEAVGACGHVGAGEDVTMASLRELQEEIGIATDLMFHGKTYIHDGNESKFYHIYYGIYDGNDFILDAEEVEAVKWLPVKDITAWGEENNYEKWIIQQIKEIAQTTAVAS